jgi:4-amino-4-deoxy-L-arabinose transferase-like glycosyltransferase
MDAACRAGRGQIQDRCAAISKSKIIFIPVRAIGQATERSSSINDGAGSKAPSGPVLRKPQKFPAAAFVAILLLAAGIRLYTVFSESLSPDEYYQRLIILQPYLQQVKALRTDIVHPPFYYWMARAVSSVVGFGQFGLRLPSLFFGLLTVVLTMILGIRLFGNRRIALAAGLLVSVSDIQIVASHFARSYAMLSAAALIYLIVLDWALRNRERDAPWWILTGLSVLLVYTHYLVWLYIIAVFPVLLARNNRKALGRWLASAAVTAICSLPWIIYVLPSLKKAGGLDTVLSGFGTPGPRALAEIYARYTGPAHSGFAILVSCAAGLLFLVAGATAGRRVESSSPQSIGDGSTQALRLLWFFALIPPVLLFVLAVPPIEYRIWGFRHLIPVQAPWALLLCYGALHIAPRRRMVFPAAILFLACLQLIPTSDALLNYWFEPFARVARVLKSERLPTESLPLYTLEFRETQIMSFYLADEKNVFLLPPGDEELPGRFWLVCHPFRAFDSERLQRLKAAGYSSERERDFIKRPGDARGLRLVLLKNPKRLESAPRNPGVDPSLR